MKNEASNHFEKEVIPPGFSEVTLVITPNEEQAIRAYLAHTESLRGRSQKQLRGSEKQITWASEIRAQKTAGSCNIHPDERETLNALTSAHFWIEHRSKSLPALLELARKTYPRPAFYFENDAATAEKKAMTIVPDGWRSTNGVAELSVSQTNDFFFLVFPYGYDGISKTAKRHGFHWNNDHRYHSRRVHGIAALKDEFALVASSLLDKDIALEIANEELREYVVGGEFKDAPTRVVDIDVTAEYGTKFAFRWLDLSSRAIAALENTLKGKLFDNVLFVNINSWETVKDAASEYGFSFTKEAQRAIDEGSNQELKKLGIKIKPPRINAAPTCENIILKQQPTGTADEELLDV